MILKSISNTAELTEYVSKEFKYHILQQFSDVALPAPLDRFLPKFSESACEEPESWECVTYKDFLNEMRNRKSSEKLHRALKFGFDKVVVGVTVVPGYSSCSGKLFKEVRVVGIDSHEGNIIWSIELPDLKDVDWSTAVVKLFSFSNGLNILISSSTGLKLFDVDISSNAGPHISPIPLHDAPRYMHVISVLESDVDGGKLMLMVSCCMHCYCIDDILYFIALIWFL